MIKIIQNDRDRFVFSTPESTAIKHIKYDRLGKNLEITFQSGGTYEYPNVPEEIIDSWAKASSIGQYFHQKIKRYSATRIHMNEL